MVPTPESTIDYLTIGHITQDLTRKGQLLGGTVTYAGLTATALGYRTAILTSVASDVDLSALQDLELKVIPSETSSIFENIYGKNGRRQFIRGKARDITVADLPSAWRNPRLVHLAPLTGEVDPAFVHEFEDATVCLTPQGWMRQWGDDGLVGFRPWDPAPAVFEEIDAMILSIEDLGGDESLVDYFAKVCPLFVLTLGYQGARVFWNGQVRDFPPPEIEVVDPTGAGDIFSAGFFVRYDQTGDAWEAARFANELAASSVTHSGVKGIPGSSAINSALESGLS